MRTAIFFSFLTTGIGCATELPAPAPRPTPAPVRSAASTTPAPAPPPPPDPRAPIDLSLPAASAVAPSWFRPPVRFVANDFSGVPNYPATVGTKVAVVEVSERFFVVHAERGVIGAVAVPPATWYVLVGAGERIFAAARGGQLHRAADIEAAMRGDFALVARVPDALSWDAAGGHVVAATSSDVFVSDDDGDTFTKRTPAAMSVDGVGARPDGIIAAWGMHDDPPGGELWASRDGGKAWRRASLPKVGVGHFERRGDWIWTGYASCPATLTVNATALSLDVDLDAGFAARDPALYVDPLYRGAGFAEAPSLGPGRPPAPPPPRAAPSIDDLERCVAFIGQAMPYSTGAYRSEFRRAVRDPDPSFAFHEHFGVFDSAAPNPATDFTYLLLHDGTCRAADAEDHGACKAGATLTRRPHAAVVPVGNKPPLPPRVVDLPSGCDPAEILSAGGIGVLLCRAGSGSGLFTLDARGDFHDEGTLPLAADALYEASVARDGTMVLHAHCVAGAEGASHRCEAAVRRPLELGTAGAWRAHHDADALAYRPLEGGRILAIAARAPRERADFTLLVNGAPLATVANTEPVGELRVEDGRVRVYRNSVIGYDATSALVTNGGALLPVPVAPAATPEP